MDIYKLLEKLDGEIVSNKAMVVIDGDPVEIGGIVDNEFQLNERGMELAAAHKDSPAPASTKRKRARNEDGTLKADDPSTPNINEAWEHGDD
tara:strand:+ start:275 stop:550 length:276 start_codon:yes stop_codon:yes gene_type:complete